MPYETENIVKGGATIIFAGQPIGWTRDACVIAVEDDKLIIDDVQQKQGVVDVRRTKVGFQVRVNLYEYTMENLKNAWGINANIQQLSTTRKMLLNVSGDYPQGELLIYGKGENNINRTVKFYKAKLIERGDIELDAHNYTVIPITFQVIVHPDFEEVGYVEQEYTPSTIIE